MNANQKKQHRERLHLGQLTLLEYVQLYNSLEISSSFVQLAIVSGFSNNIIEKVLSVDFFSYDIPISFCPESFENIEVQITNLKESASTMRVLVIISDQDLIINSSFTVSDIKKRIDNLFQLIEKRVSLQFIFTPILTVHNNLDSKFWAEINSFIHNRTKNSKNSSYLIALESRWNDSNNLVAQESYLSQTNPLTIGGVRDLSLSLLIEISKDTTPGAKLILLDADNTLWHGVLGESGVAGVISQFENPNNEFYIFQNKLIKMREEGILLAILSKNNLEEIKDLFNYNSMMPLRSDHFTYISANWDDKWVNANKIAKDLNLGLSSFVFLDDNPFERNLMRKRAPEIFTPEPSADGMFVELLETIIPLAPRNRSNEDFQRVAYYRQSRQVEDEASRYSDRISFLSELQMSAKVTSNHNLDQLRALQLIQKTNQFNMTGLRMDLAQLKSLLESTNFLFFQVSLVDKFGDNGNVLLSGFELKGNAHAEISIFNMSCRVIGRDLEYAFLSWAAEKLQIEYGVKTINVNVNITAKNQPFVGFFNSAGFEQIDQSCYSIDLSQRNVSTTGIKIEILEE